MRKQDSTAFVISLVALRTADGEAPAIVIVEAKNLTSSLELGSALLKWSRSTLQRSQSCKPVTSNPPVEHMAVSEARGADGEH